MVDDFLLEVVHRRDCVASRLKLHDAHVNLILRKEAHREIIERPETVLRTLLRELQVRERVVVVAVGEVLLAELKAEMQVVRIPLDASGEVVEHELVLLALHGDGVVFLPVRAQGLDLLVVILHLRLRKHAVQLRVHRAGNLNRLLQDVNRLVEALALNIDSRECTAGIHVLRLRLDLLQLFLDEKFRVIARHDGLIGRVKLRRLLLVRDQRLETALLADRLGPARIHRRLRFGVLQKLHHALVARFHLRKLLIGVTDLVPALRHRVIGGDTLQKRRILVGAFVGRLNGNGGMLCLPRGFSGLDSRLDVVGVQRILAEKLLGLGHRLDAFALLHQTQYLLPSHHIAKFRAETDLAILLEIGDLGRPQELTRLQNVRRGRNGLHQHVDCELVTPRLQGLTAAVGEILRLLREINCHHETSIRSSSILPRTPPVL